MIHKFLLALAMSAIALVGCEDSNSSPVGIWKLDGEATVAACSSWMVEVAGPAGRGLLTPLLREQMVWEFEKRNLTIELKLDGEAVVTSADYAGHGILGSWVEMDGQITVTAQGQGSLWFVNHALKGAIWGGRLMFKNLNDPSFDFVYVRVR